MAHRLLHDPDADGWERGDFPIVCETCLGPNPYVRMQRIEFGGQCHISGRPYTVFRWRPGNDARYKKTIICQEVAKAKNVCQVCLFDLDYGLPVQVRDTLMGIEKEDIPASEVGKEFQLNEALQRGENDSSYGGAPTDMLQRLARTSPYYKRNQSKICTFFTRGKCKRGAECPYRHEMPEDNELSKQNIKDRYYGINDPVANKILRRVADEPKLEPPEDKSITSLYIGGVTSDISEEDLRGVFYPYGALAGVRKVASRFCAFVQFAERSGAEAAAEALHNRLTVKGVRLRMMWGRPQPPRESGGGPGAGGRPGDEAMQPVQSSRGGGAGSMAAAAAPAGTVPPPDYFGLAPPTLTSGPSQYPSMDPTAMGARLPKRVGGDDGEGSGSKRSKAGGDGDGAAASFGGDRLSGFGAFAVPSAAAVPAEAPAPAAS